jgi:hypothetical protein
MKGTEAPITAAFLLKPYIVPRDSQGVELVVYFLYGCFGNKGH